MNINDEIKLREFLAENPGIAEHINGLESDAKIGSLLGDAAADLGSRCDEIEEADVREDYATVEHEGRRLAEKLAALLRECDL